MSASERFPRYRKLLKLYPKTYRDHYESAHLQTLADMLDDQPTTRGRADVWLKTCLDFPITLTTQLAINLEGTVMNEVPQHVRWGGLIGGACLLPFLAALLANSLDNAINHHSLYATWVWSYPALVVWVLVLPALALGISAVTFLIYLSRETKVHRGGWLMAVVDIRRNWPAVLVGGAAAAVLFILFFHDSVHCFARNPLYLFSHWHAAMVCARNS